jgi:predicted transcriptional regulator
MVSVADILKAMYDDKSLCIFNTIGLANDFDSDILIRNMDLSCKQFYSRIRKLTEAGLVKRHKARYHLTSLGKIVYHAQLLIGNAVRDYWKLKALDSLHVSDNGIPIEEQEKIINTIIDDQKIKKMILLRQM